ncbi:hypothetical protein WKH56_19810 [Priestia sp. SB1]|uniref:helix-hairpin-helix domain-containing protein n=1 Tax=Priestia sp. SB1 TaxID=3132359 RepID=UPI00317BF30D
MARKELLQYVWDTQILPQAGYSFSRLHSVGYSLIALQEMNLAHFYPQVYWNTACLSVNAGADENSEDNKGTKYGKVATAIGNMMQRGITVTLPDINKAGFGFTPDVEHNSIIFGLKGINGIGDSVVQDIIANRPFTSFEDFISKMFSTGLLKKSHMIHLIKAGCFDSFDDRLIIMKRFIEMIVEPKTKLTMSNLKMLIEYNLVPERYRLEVRFFKFKDYISKKVHKNISKPKDRLLILDDISTNFFNEHFPDNLIVDFHDGKVVISEKQFKKEYDKKMEKIKVWITGEEALYLLNSSLMEDEWNKYCSGTLSSWEMSSLGFYHTSHELEHVNKEKYGIRSFHSLSEEPKVVSTHEWRGREMKEYEIGRIVGTVLDKDKIKHTVTLLTDSGVVVVKFYGGAYSHYDRQISQVDRDGKKKVLEKSWFARGIKLMVTGFRRESNFMPKVYKNSIYNHTVALIEDIDERGNLTLQTERIRN